MFTKIGNLPWCLPDERTFVGEAYGEETNLFTATQRGAERRGCTGHDFGLCARQIEATILARFSGDEIRSELLASSNVFFSRSSSEKCYFDRYFHVHWLIC